MDHSPELILIGFSANYFNRGFCEFYVTRVDGLYMYCGGIWENVSKDVDEIEFMSEMSNDFDTAREATLLRYYNQWLAIQPSDDIASGLSHCVIPDLIPIISGYLAAMKPCPLPVPSEDDICRLGRLNGFHVRGEIFPELNIYDELIVESWHSDDLAECTYLGIDNNGIGYWSQDTGDDSSEYTLFYHLLLSSRRAQVLGLPLR